MSTWRRRVRQPLTACMAVCLLLFAQLALAGYLCPQWTPAQAQAPMVMDGDMPCEGMDASQPVLCHAHCTDDGATVVSLAAPVFPPPSPHGLLTQTLAQLLDHTERRPLAAEPVAQPPPAPLFLSTLRLRV